MSKAILLTSVAVISGFAIGLGIGKSTRQAAPSNVSADYKDGKVIVVADVAQSLKTGVADFLGGLI